MTTVHYFGGVSWTEEDRSPIVEALTAEPEMLDTFREKCLETITGMMGWGAYDSAIESFADLCRVEAAVRSNLGLPSGGVSVELSRGEIKATLSAIQSKVQLSRRTLDEDGNEVIEQLN